MANPGFSKTFDAITDIPAYRIVKAVNGGAALASSPEDHVLGISTTVDAFEGNGVDVVFDRSAELKLGNAVSFGDPITSDANGCGVTAASGEKYVGTALRDGALDDIIPVLVRPGLLP
jgi:hypothetical protein